MMTKVTTEAVKFVMASARQLKRRHQIPAVARILGVCEGTIRNRLKKKGPKKQYARRKRVERPPGWPAIAYLDEDAPSVPLTEADNAVMAALIEHMGDELDGMTF
jgi:transcription initiation factor TFIIIB Brf1 subunit/transcription initiation factor TFIIB